MLSLTKQYFSCIVQNGIYINDPTLIYKDLFFDPYS